MSQLTIDQVKNMQTPPKSFLCKLKANRFALQFLEMTVKNPETGKVFVDVQMEENSNDDLLINDDDYSPDMLQMFNEMRKKTYHFPPNFFDQKLLSLNLKFKVGDMEVKNLTIVENYYFKNDRISSYVFTFPFCAPNGKNTWELIYEVPKLKQEYLDEIQKNNASTISETFFFVEDEMIMHNKSEYFFDN